MDDMKQDFLLFLFFIFQDMENFPPWWYVKCYLSFYKFPTSIWQLLSAL